MKNQKISTREMIMLGFLVVLLIGVCYYMFFYTPLQEEMTRLSNESAQADLDIASATAKATSKKKMNDELQEIFKRPEEEITEIAPYDNKEVVLNMLYGILARTKDYSLSFQDPTVQDDGTVRRAIAMNFTCDDYEAAKAVVKDLTDCNWRCLVSNMTMSSEDLMKGTVTVSVNITFFESTKLLPAAKK